MYRIALVMMVLAVMASGKEYKAVFDCSSDNIRYISGRMKLIDITRSLIEKQGNSTRFALTLHGGCVPMVLKNPDEMVDNDDLPFIHKTQETLKRLNDEKKLEIIACAMSLKANGIDRSDVLPFVKISEDSFIDTIGYQNDGYALMTFP